MNTPTPPLGHVTSWSSEPWHTSAAEPMAVFAGAQKVGYGYDPAQAKRLVEAHNAAMERLLALTLGAVEAARQ